MTPFKISSKVKKKLGIIDQNNDNLNYSLQPFVSKWLRDHPPELSYALKAPEMSFETWKQQVKELILKKIPTLERLPFNKQQLKIYGETLSSGIKFIQFSLMTIPGLRVPGIMCIPENVEYKAPACICIHGHGQNIYNTIGMKRSKNKEYFGYELAKLGLITLSFDWIGSGIRESFKNKFLFFLQDEGQRANWLRFIGLDMLGLRITEVKSLINYLLNHNNVDSKRLGIIGHSGGGTLSLFTAIFDDRIKVCATSGYLSTWDHSILAMYHCGCNYIADLRKYLELYDVYASLAPRPLAITIGKRDKIFPYKGTQISIPIIKEAYQEANHPENLLIHVQKEGHKFSGEKIYPFILSHL
ncbi:MAG: alpha/beta hydrolase family protein [Candidatus Hermodarchaeota archaeon]